MARAAGDILFVDTNLVTFADIAVWAPIAAGERGVIGGVDRCPSGG